MKKYTLITNNNIIINDIEIDINDSQVIRLIESTGATLFESEYNKDYFFINATTEQIKILNTLDCITAIEQYDESYFIVLYTIKKIEYTLNQLECAKASLSYKKSEYNKIINTLETQIITLKNQA